MKNKDNQKNNWQTKKLGEVCNVIAGQSPKGKYYNTVSEGLPFYQGKKRFTEKFIGEPTTWTIKVTKEALKGDILMSVRAPVGPINIATQKICIGRGLAAIRAGKEMEFDFLSYFLKSFEDEIIGNHGAVFNSISKTQIEAIQIPLPPLPEQKRIVKILDEVFEKIEKAKENAKKNLENSKELFEAVLQEVFEEGGEDWKEKTLKDCFRLKSGDMLTSKMMKEGKFPVYGGNGIAGLHDSYNLSGDNVIVGRVGALCGNVRNMNEKIWLTDNAFRLVDFKYEFNNSFLTYLLNFKKLRKLARQTAQPVISNSSLKDLPLQFPKSINKQQQIVKKLDALSAQTKKLEKIYQQKLDDLEELKKSVLKKAFKGEL